MVPQVVKILDCDLHVSISETFFPEHAVGSTGQPSNLADPLFAFDVRAHQDCFGLIALDPFGNQPGGVNDGRPD